MSLFGANTSDEELKEAINVIKRIITNREEIIYSNISGYSLGNIDDMREKRQPGEQIKITYWDEL
jgi:hypothetical protein